MTISQGKVQSDLRSLSAPWELCFLFLHGGALRKSPQSLRPFVLVNDPEQS